MMFVSVYVVNKKNKINVKHFVIKKKKKQMQPPGLYIIKLIRPANN